MSIIIPKPTQNNFEPIPAGNYVGRCISMIDLGTQEFIYLGESKKQRKVRISFETPMEQKVFSTEKGEQPYLLSKEFGLSMNEKAALRKNLESWRGKPYTEEELENFDITKVLGQPCMINIIHKEKNGKIYVDIASITPLPKGLTCPDPINKIVEFSIEDFNQDIFDSLPDFLKEKITNSPEFIKKMDELSKDFQSTPEVEI